MGLITKGLYKIKYIYIFKCGKIVFREGQVNLGKLPEKLH